MSPHRQPTPNTAPNPTTPEHPVLSRIGGLALTALGGYALHKGFHADFLGNPAESMGTPTGEIIETTVIASTVALTGLRSQITDIRLGRTWGKYGEAVGQEHTAERSAKLTQDSYTRIMDGTPVAYDTDPLSDTIQNNPVDRLVAAHRKIRHPQRQSKPTDSQRATSSMWHDRRVRKMVRQRNSRRHHEYEEETAHRWFARDSNYDPANKKQPTTQTGDLGSELGWKRYFQTPKSGLEVRGYRNAVERAEHAKHKSHAITESVRNATVVKAENKIKMYKDRKDRLRKKADDLQTKKIRIATRQDAPSKIYDTAKSKANSGARKTALAGGKWAKGIATAPRVYREARDEGAGNSGRVQNQINRLAYNIGERRGQSRSNST